MTKITKGISVFTKRILPVLLLSSTLAQSVNAEENLIINGSFENHGELNRGSWGTFRSIEGWRANRGLLEVQHNNVSGIGPVDGIAKIELDSHYNSRIYQDLNLVEGETYRLSLNYSPRTTHRNSNKVRIKWNRKKIAVLNGRQKGWTQHSFDIVAKAKNRLKLHAAGRSDSYGGLIDDVSLVCITCDTGANTAPVADSQSITVLEDSTDNSITLTASDADGDALTYTVTDPSQGTLSGQAPNLTYTPNANYFGSDSFSFTVSDGIETDTATVSITIDDVAEPTSTVNARVSTPAGEVLDGVSIVAIAADNSTTNFTTGTDGRVNIELDVSQEYVLQFTKDGYANQVTPVKTPTENGAINLDITMVARGEVQTFNAADGGVFNGDELAAVSIQPNSFVDANDELVTGEIQVTITPVDVSNPSSLAAFPGEFTGTTNNGDTPIISFGTVEYVFTQNGEPVQLAEGVTADILIPIYIDTYQDGSPLQSGDTIPLWSLNEETGIWLQEGEGTVISPIQIGDSSASSPTGLYLSAQVSHFTWWNCDVSMDAAQAIVTVTGSQAGTALIKATTNANIGFRPDTVDTVTEIGVPTSPLFIPSNGEVCFIADVNYADGTSGTTQEVCDVYTGTDNTITLTASEPGPLNIAANGNNGPLDIAVFSGINLSKIRLYPTTAETNISYSVVSGSLPPGLSLNVIDAVRAEIVGTPNTAGSYTVEIGATDSDGNLDNLVINFNISDINSETPILEVRFYQNPVSVFVGMDPGTFFFELLPLEGIYIGEDLISTNLFDVGCDQNAIDFNTPGTYEMGCAADPALGNGIAVSVPTTLTVIVRDLVLE